MNQYFTRIEELSKSEKLPPRIRFMLQDVAELRAHNWLPKPSGSVKENPKPIEDIRREAYDELGILDASAADDFRFMNIGKAASTQCQLSIGGYLNIDRAHQLKARLLRAFLK